MKIFILLLSCLVCCVTASRLGLTKKVLWANTLRKDQQNGFTSSKAISANQRQQFLLNVLLQVQKPLVNTQLIQLGQALVTNPKMYSLPNDGILQEFLQQASNQEILGRNDVYNSVDMAHVRQLVGLQRFFALARDFNTFQQNVIYARLYINPVMFVDALSLAVRDRQDTQDLVLPPMNEILPQLYYDNNILFSAQNVDFNDLITQVTNVRPTFLDLIGFRKLAQFNPWQQRRVQMTFGSQINPQGVGNYAMMTGRRRVATSGTGFDYYSNKPLARTILPVGEQNTQYVDLTNDIGLNIVWKNVIMDQMAQTVIEDAENGQQIGGFGDNKQYNTLQSQLQSEQYDKKRAGFVGVQQYSMPYRNYNSGSEDIYQNLRSQQAFYGNQNQIQSQSYGTYGDRSGQTQNQINAKTQRLIGLLGIKALSKQTGIKVEELPEVDVNDERLLRVSRRRQVNPLFSSNTKESELYDQGRQNGYNVREYDYTFPKQNRDRQNEYSGREYGYGISKQSQGRRNVYNTAQYGYDYQEQPSSISRSRSGSYQQSITQKLEGLEGMRDEIMNGLSITKQLSNMRRGEILLQSIQELAARLYMQQSVENFEEGIDQAEQGRKQYRQQQQQETQREINTVMYTLQTLIEQVRQELGISKQNSETLNIIANILNGNMLQEQLQPVIGIQRTYQSLQQQVKRIIGQQSGQASEVIPLALIAGNLRDPLTQQAILSIAQLIEEYRQLLQSYTNTELLSDEGISIQNVQFDPLVTYTEVVDADLVNLIDQQLLQSSVNNLQYLDKKVVAREQRLNYDPFNIFINIESQRQQPIAIRVLLGPQIDNNGRRISLAENRQNFVVLDAFVYQLQPGVNYIQRNSRQFSATSRDVSTISQIYREVMTGQQQQQLNSSNRQTPQRILLPRGSTVGGGFPVQMMVVATPLTQQDLALQQKGVNLQQISGLGIAGLGVDLLPLSFPLDRPIANSQSLNLPNIMLTESVIQHENRVRA